MLDYLRKRPMIIAAVGCILSAVCGFYFKSALFLCLLMSIFVGIWHLRKKNTTAVTVMILVVIMNLSTAYELWQISSLSKLENTTRTAEICFEKTDFQKNNYCISEFEVIGGDIPKGTRLSLSHTPFYCETGEIIKAQIRLEALSEDYRVSQFSDGIYLSGKIEAFSRTKHKDEVLGAVENLRNYIRKWLFSNMSYESAATVSALVFGDKSYFSDEFDENVRASGVAHVMVVSGMHLSVIVTMILNITERYVYNSKIKAVIMLMTVLLLSAVCGFTKSILRAGITYVIMALGILLKRSYTPENALGTAVTFILISSPFVIFNVSFQLSVLSTFGILAVALPIYDFLKGKLKGVLKWTIQTAVLSLSAMLMTLPVVIYVFGEVSTVGVTTNLLIGVPASFCLSIAVIALILSPFLPFMAGSLLSICDIAVRYVNDVINFMGSLGFSAVTVGKWAVAVSVILIFSVLRLMLACKVRKSMLKLEAMNRKIISERGSKSKWRSFTKNN